MWPGGGRRAAWGRGDRGAATPACPSVTRGGRRPRPWGDPRAGWGQAVMGGAPAGRHRDGMASTTVLERPGPAGADPVTAVPVAAGRDLTVDLLRAVAMTLVVVGHWLVVVPSYTGGRFGGINALETVPLMRGLSWVFQ